VGVAPAASARASTASASALLATAVADAELAALRRAERDVGVLREFGPRVQHQEELASQPEHRRRSRQRDIVAWVLAADDPARFEAEAVPVELQRALEIPYGERDHVDVRLHLLPLRWRPVRPPSGGR